jgi:hypothetical protein
LPISDIRATVKSVSKWTWARFSLEQFSRIQSERVKSRWAGHKASPWVELGLSRASYYRKGGAKGLLSDMVSSHPSATPLLSDMVIVQNECQPTPWEAAGISRRTYYRRKKAAGTSI